MMHYFWRSVFIAGLILLSGGHLFAQENPFPSRVVEYRPAPGQHINDTLTGIPESTDKLTLGTDGLVSLGAYGGYIVLAFDHRIMNDPDNPFGVDFTIAGNAFPGSSEPGIVRVMKDENGNGLPDDTWYEIAGSLHHSRLVKQEYTLRYYNQPDAEGNIPWRDDGGIQGFVYHNTYHEQPYYPMQEHFPEISRDSLGFSGSLLDFPVSEIGGIFRTRTLEFGYADNRPVNASADHAIPDNPYTPAIAEGYGGDAIDISWAVNEAGDYVDLDGIDFVMVYTAVNANAGSIGEISTEMRSVIDVPPNPGIKGEYDMISLENVPENLLAHDTLELKAVVLSYGRPVEEEVVWQSGQPEIAVIDDQNFLIAKGSGSILLTAMSKSDTSVRATHEIKVHYPSDILYEKDFTYLMEEGTGTLKTSVIDDDGSAIRGLMPEARVEDPSIVEIDGINNGVIYLRGLKNGETRISLYLKDFPGLTKELSVKVSASVLPLKVSASVKTGNENLILRRIYEVHLMDILPYTDRTSPEYQPAEDNYINLAHAVSQVFLRNGFTSLENSFAFRADEYSEGKLYLWKVGKNWEYYYGWGNLKNDPDYQACWMVMLNGNVYYNNLDKIRVEEGDHISLVRIENTSEPWENLVLHSEKNYVYPGEAITVGAELFRVVPEDGALNQETIDFPADRDLIVNGEVFGRMANLRKEDENAIYFTIEETGIHQLWVEGFPEEKLSLEVLHSLDVKHEARDVIRVFPNPFDLYIQVEYPAMASAHILLYNMNGRLVYQSEVYHTSRHRIPAVYLESGVYLLEVSDEWDVYRRKMIKK